MPNNDLGTAHGRIRIDFDDQGSTKATTSLAKVEKQFEEMQARVIELERQLKKNGSTLEKSSNSLRKVERHTKGAAISFFGFDRITKILDKDVIDLTQDLLKLANAYVEVREKAKPLENIYRTLDKFQNLKPDIPVSNLGRALNALRFNSLDEGRKKVRAFYLALGGFEFVKAVTVKGWNEIAWAQTSALRRMPVWTQQIAKFGGVLTRIGAIGLIVGKALDAGFINRFLNTGVFRQIVNQSNNASNALQKLGNISKRVFGRDLFGGFATRLKGTEGALENFTKQTSYRLSGASRVFNAAFKPIDSFGKSAQKFVIGAAMVSAGITDILAKFGWLNRIPRPLLVALGTVISAVLPAAVQVLAKSLAFLSNVFVGLLSGVKELSGGLLTLPGLMAQIGVVAGTLRTIFFGLSDQFKDVFSTDPAEAAEAWAKLPEHLKPMAAALKETVKGFRAMQVELQKVAFKGIEDQIKSLTEIYMPLLETNMKKVTLALRTGKDSLVEFLQQGQTQKDINTIFDDTAELLGNVKYAIKPIADGLRNMAVVGSRFITDMSGGLGGLSQRFAEWTRVNRESGQMMRWMQDARKGLVDLTKGTWDLTKGLWSLLTMFRTSPAGGDWLRKYADSMKELNSAINQSKKGGMLYDLVSGIKALGDSREKIDTFKQVFKAFLDMFQSVAPAIKNISDAFSSLFIPQIIFSLEWVAKLADGIKALGLDSFAGYILGIIATFKLFPTFLMPVVNGIRTLWGTFLMFKSIGGVMGGVRKGVEQVVEKISKLGEDAAGAGLTRLGDAAKRTAGSLKNVSGTLATIASNIVAFGTPIAAAAAAMAAVWLVIDNTNDNLKAFDAQLDLNKTTLVEWGKALNKAFMSDEGLVGTTVMDQVSLGLDDMIRNMEETAAKGPGFMDHIGDFLKPKAGFVGNLLGGESTQMNDWQQEADEASNAAKKLRELRKEGVDLESKMAGSRPAFDAYIANLRTQGKEGNAAADVLAKQRKQFDLVYQAMQQIGPAGVELANGIQQIAEAGGNATSRLEGLTAVLQGLGFLKVDAMEAAANYTNALDDLANRVQQVVDANGSMADAWDTSTNTLNTQTKAGAALVPIFKELSLAYRTAANAGEDVDSLTSRLNSSLDSIAGQVGTTGDKLREFFRNNMGIAPTPIKIALQLEGKELIAQQVGEFVLQLIRQVETGIPIQMKFESENAASDFEESLKNILGRDITDRNGLIVSVTPGMQVNPAELQRLQDTLATYGIQLPNGPVVDPAKIPVALPPPPIPAPPVLPGQPNAQPPWLPNAVPQPFSPQPANPFYPAPPDTRYPPVAPGNTDPNAPKPVIIENPVLPNLQEANTQVDEITGKMQKFAANPVNIEVNTEKLKTANTEIDQLSAKFFDKKLTANIQVEGVDKLQEIPGKAQAIADQFTSVFTTFKDKINEAVEITTTKIGELSQAVIDTLTGAADNAREAGSKFVDALAQGIETNPAAVQAAERLAAEIKERFHQSPPKKGPLAEHGDAALYGGKAFVSSYASGLRTAAPTAADAAGVVAGAAAGALGTNAPGSEAGAFFGQLTELASFASSIVDIFSRISDSVFQFAKFLSDPMGKGSFFGGSLGFKKLSEAELKRRKEEKEQQDVRSMMDSPTRNTEDYERRLEIITNAQNAVVRDSGSVKSQEAPRTVGALLKEAFPEIASIGGSRPDRLPFHREGRALDIMIPDYNTEEGKALGDRINAWALANAEKIGLVDTIWQDYWQPADGGRGNFMGNTDPTQGHYDHVHLTFAPGASVDLSGIEMSPEELSNYQKTADKNKAKTALERLQEQYGPPLLDGEELPVEDTMMRYNAQTGNYEIYTPHGKEELPGPGRINPETDKPYTAEESLLYEQRNPLEYTLPEGMTPDRLNEMVRDPNFVVESQQQTLERVTGANAAMADALRMAENPENFSDDQLIQTLTALDNEIFRLNENDTPGNRQIARDLETVKSTIMDVGGFEQNANPIDTVASIAQQAAGVASDIIGTVITGIEAIGAADDIAKTLVRGVANTKDVDRVIDNVQKFIELGAKISGSVASVTGLISSIVGAGGGADPSGGASGVAAALGSISTIASLVQAGFETTNAVIDMTQEAMRIAGTYVGDFLGYLVGGMGGQLTGNVKFLLDKQTNQLLTYTAENAMDKRIHNVPFAPRDMASREQLIGNINVYGGPGSDPRDLTRQMMYQVNSAQYAGALAQ